MEPKIKSPEARYKGDVETTLAETLSVPRQPLGNMTRIYLQNLPRLIEKVSNHHAGEINQKLKAGYVSFETARAITGSMAKWPNFDHDLAKTYLGEVLPKLISISSLTKGNNDEISANMGWRVLTEQVGKGQVSIMSPMCPPYTYKVGENGKLKHASGEIQPTVGQRFETSIGSIANALEPLTERGVEVNIEFWTYSGETGNLQDLSDLGEDVIEHYKKVGMHGLFDNLNSAYKEMQMVTKKVLGPKRITSNTVSIDTKYGPHITALVEEFKNSFPKCTTRIEPYEEQIKNWLKAKVGVDDGWLSFFLEEELEYRGKQNGLIKDGENLLESAFREGLLYLLMTQYADRNENLIFDLETTSNYMVGSLRHFRAPVIMGTAFDHTKPHDTYNIRQPYNIPTNI